MCLISENGEMKDAIAFAYSDTLREASKAGAEVGDEDIVVVVKRNMTNVRIKDDGHVQAGTIPSDDWRRATYLVFFVCAHLLNSFTLGITE